MRRIAVINQKGGVGKTTTCVNLGAALALSGRRVVILDMDAQANLTLALGIEVPPGAPSTYTVLLGGSKIAESLHDTSTPGLRILAANIDLSGAELELAGAMGREHLLREALEDWETNARASEGRAPADYVLFDCPPSLGLLSVNALAAAHEVLIAIQTEFLALQGMSKLVEILKLLKKRLNPSLEIAGILPCLYDSRLKLAREVLAEIRRYFPGEVFAAPVRTNVKLAEAPSFGKTIFEYAPESNGAQDYLAVARAIARGESADAELAALPPIESPRAAIEPARSSTEPSRSSTEPSRSSTEPSRTSTEPARDATDTAPSERAETQRAPTDGAPSESSPAPRAPSERKKPRRARVDRTPAHGETGVSPRPARAESAPSSPLPVTTLTPFTPPVEIGTKAEARPPLPPDPFENLESYVQQR